MTTSGRARSRRQRIAVRGVDLAVAVSEPDGVPDRPWFVWGHGLTSSMAREDEFGLLDHAALAATAGTVRYDARGHGASGSTDDPDDYHWRELAADQLAVLDAVGIGRYVAGGASMGCATALYAALAAPDRVRGLVLVIPPTAWATRAEQRALYEANAALVASGRVDDLIDAAAQLPLPDPLSGDPSWRTGFEREMRAADPERLARIFRGAGRTDLPPLAALASIEVPTAVLAWTGDPGHPVSTAESLAATIPDAALHLASTADELGAWTDVVIGLLDRIAGGQ